MKKDIFATGTPESAGVPSDAVEWLLDQLESGFTEPHGIMIMRNDILCAQGWWAPFAPGIRHGEQSHSKTYSATAIGIAYTQGKLSLDERLIDIFPEEAPENPSEYLKKLTIRNVLCMGSGMREEPKASEHWIRDFLSMPVVDEPGTAFMYNTTGSSMLAAIVKKKTGMGMHEFLMENLYQKIGIDGANHKWIRTSDGIEAGGAGLFATLEDNFRLMKLYMNGGVWNGEQILAEDFVRAAISKQIDTASEAKVNPPATDNFLGYGYQIWMCQPEGVYRADGAMGQFTIVVPDKNMEIAIMENASGAHWAQKTLDVLWEFLEKIPSETSLKEEPEKAEQLQRRLKSLSLPAPEFRPCGSASGKLYGRRLHFAEPLRLDAYGLLQGCSDAIREIMVTDLLITETEDPMTLRMKLWLENSADQNESAEQDILVGLDGMWRESHLATGILDRLLAAAYWSKESCLELSLRWIETCGAETLRLEVAEDGVTANLTGTLAFHDDQRNIKGYFA